MLFIKLVYVIYIIFSKLYLYWIGYIFGEEYWLLFDLDLCFVCFSCYFVLG